MAAPQKKKKKAPGGATGAPPRSEPKVQLFSKFAGCNFQLATRDFDRIFDEGQDAQTDLMPMLMAIQNNAGIAPFGGIESRQNMTKLFDAPTGKSLTGVATLVGDKLYAALDDMTVNYGTLPLTGAAALDQSVTIEDNNSTYAPQVQHSYTPLTQIVSVERLAASYTDGLNILVTLSDPFSQSVTFDRRTEFSGFTVKMRYNGTGGKILVAKVFVDEAARDADTYIASDTAAVTTGHDGEVRFDFTQVIDPGTYIVSVSVLTGDENLFQAYAGPAYYPGGVAALFGPGGWTDQSYDFYFKAWEVPIWTFSQAHTVVASGLIAKVKVFTGGETLVFVYHGDSVTGELLFQGNMIDGTDISLMHDVTVGDTVTIIAISGAEGFLDNPRAEFYESADNNTWTFLGYADDQLVGMTANLQLWSAPLAQNKLANAFRLDDPASALSFTTDLDPVGAITISPTGPTATEVYRVTVCYTLLNRFGPTLPSPPLTFWASKPTIEWTQADHVRVSGTAPNYVTIGDGNGFAGVTAVELYFTEDEYQEYNFLGRVGVPDVVATPVENSLATKPWSFEWIGYLVDVSDWTIANLTIPTQNYTLGAPASKMAVLDGQLYFWGGDPAHRIWVGGNPGNRFSVSPGTGGGFLDVEPGSGTEVRKVLKFKTQQGAAIVTALCDNQNSHKEHRFNLVETSLSLSNEQSSKAWQAEKIAGAVGCKSSNGALVAGDGLYAISRYGLAITTLTMEYNSQLQVMYVSDPIAPVFLKQYGNQLDMSVLFEVNGILYMTFGSADGSLDNIIFCYDIALKAWWTYTLDVDEPILNMIHIDYEGTREGIGVITADAVYLLPTTIDEPTETIPVHSVLIESGELTTMQPIQAMHHLSQLEFRFDHFIGDMNIKVTMIDQFGRTITTERTVSHATLQHQLSEYMRIDAVVESYKIRMTGRAKFRLTHFLAKTYPKSNRIGMSWGFDDRQSHSSSGSIHHTFASYNDLRDAIIP